MGKEKVTVRAQKHFNWQFEPNVDHRWTIRTMYVRCASDEAKTPFTR